jgi:hypothetical protein
MGVENLSILHSANRGGEKQIHVLVKNGRGATRTTITFNVAGKDYTQHVVLEPGEHRHVSTPHEETGRRWVVVTASGWGFEASKWLDLDASESF